MNLRSSNLHCSGVSCTVLFHTLNSHDGYQERHLLFVSEDTEGPYQRVPHLSVLLILHLSICFIDGVVSCIVRLRLAVLGLVRLPLNGWEM